MPKQKFTNFATSKLAASILATDTTINITAGDGVKFPTLAAGDYFVARLINDAKQPEIIKVTARATDQFTVERGQEGTTARPYIAGDTIQLILSRDLIAELLVRNPPVAKSANYTTVLDDDGGCHELGVGVSLVTLGDASALRATAAYQWTLRLKNVSGANITVTRATGTDTINRVAADITIYPGQEVAVNVNAARNGFEANLHADLVTLNTTQTILADKTIQSSDAGAGVGPTFTLDRNSASPAAADLLAAIPFLGRDSAGNSTEYAAIAASLSDPTDGAEGGALALKTIVAGVIADRVSIAQGVIVGSPAGGDKGVGTINAESGFYSGNVPVLPTEPTAVFTASGTFTAKVSGTHVIILQAGGGGGGGGSGGAARGGGGGGGAGEARIIAQDLVAGTGYSVTVGSGGGGGGVNTNGGAGGNTAFNGVTVVGGGGGTSTGDTPGGVGGAAGNATSGGASGGGTATAGGGASIVHGSGGAGGDSDGSYGGGGGAGAGSLLSNSGGNGGNGGHGANAGTTQAGGNAPSYGAGGGGGGGQGNASPALPGGNGGAGVVIIF